MVDNTHTAGRLKYSSFRSPKSGPPSLSAQKTSNPGMSVLVAFVLNPVYSSGINRVQDRFSLRGRVALISGGNHGLGLGFAISLAQAGAAIAVFDISAASTEFQTISETYGVQTQYYHVDVASPASIKTGFRGLKQDFGGKLDICIPCAGVHCPRPLLDTTNTDLDRLLSINVRGVYNTVQSAASFMIENGTTHGSIIIIASPQAYFAVRTHNSTAYAASKAAVAGMVPEMAKELAPYGIRVNCIMPGYTMTEMTKQAPDLLKLWSKDIMLGRLAIPEDYGGIAVYLASDSSSYVTAQDFVIDGGATKW